MQTTPLPASGDGNSILNSSIISPLLQRFRDGVGDEPQDVSVENIRHLMKNGLIIREILVRPTGAFFLFFTGEQYYAPALKLGVPELDQLAAEAGLNTYAQMRRLLGPLEENFEIVLDPLSPA